MKIRYFLINYFIRFFCSDELYNFEMESEEDEDEVIERRRRERQAIVSKYTGTTSQPASIATSVTSKASESDSDSSSSDESEDSDSVDKRATEDLEKDLELSQDKRRNVVGKDDEDSKDGVPDEKPTDGDEETEKNGDMLATDDMFSENYSVSLFILICQDFFIN